MNYLSLDYFNDCKIPLLTDPLSCSQEMHFNTPEDEIVDRLAQDTFSLYAIDLAQNTALSSKEIASDTSDKMSVFLKRGGQNITLSQLNAPLPAPQCTRTAEEKFPNHLFALIGRGDAFLTLRNLECALKDYNDAFAINPDIGSLLLRRGYTYHKLKQPILALDNLYASLDKGANKVFALSTMGDIYYSYRKFDSSLECLNAALDLDPENVFALTIKANVNAALGNSLPALMDYNKALSLNPHYKHAITGKAWIRRIIGERNFLEFDKVIPGNRQDSTPSKEKNGCLILNMPQLSIDDPEESLYFFPKIMHFYFKEGDAFRLQGALGPARKNFEKIYFNFPLYAPVLAELADIYRLQGGYNHALKFADKALELEPKNTFARLVRAVIYLEHDYPQLAMNDFEEVFRTKNP